MCKCMMKKMTSAFDGFRKDNPLLMRKKFQMKDVYFRKDDPDHEALRFELAFDLEFYVIIIAAILAVLLFAAKIKKQAKRHCQMKAERRIMREKLKNKKA